MPQLLSFFRSSQYLYKVIKRTWIYVGPIRSKQSGQIHYREPATRKIMLGPYLPICLWFRQKLPKGTNYYHIPLDLYNVYHLKCLQTLPNHFSGLNCAKLNSKSIVHFTVQHSSTIFSLVAASLQLILDTRIAFDMN